MIVAVDYGAGNLANVLKAFRYLGEEVSASSSPTTIRQADGIILPGVGAFGSAMDELKKRRLDQVLYEEAKAGKPLLGICLGMQLLFDESDEFGVHEGLHLIPGRVEAFPKDIDLLVPQMGWNQNVVNNEQSIFADVLDGSYTYFVHSYYAKCDQQYVVSYTNYGVKVPSCVEFRNVYGMQFHPEKSGEKGLEMLERFMERVDE